MYACMPLRKHARANPPLEKYNDSVHTVSTHHLVCGL